MLQVNKPGIHRRQDIGIAVSGDRADPEVEILLLFLFLHLFFPIFVFLVDKDVVHQNEEDTDLIRNQMETDIPIAMRCVDPDNVHDDKKDNADQSKGKVALE